MAFDRCDVLGMIWLVRSTLALFRAGDSLKGDS